MQPKQSNQYKTFAPHIIVLLIVLLLTIVFLSGCAGLQRAGIDAVTAAGGAGIGYAINKKNPAAAVAGAAGGLVVGELLNYGIDKQKRDQYKTGYDKGRSDEVKTLYWAQRDLQRANEADGQLRRKIIAVPMEESRTPDGVVLEKHDRFVEVVE